jgi:DNA-binding FrmR family transcriptional regulator
MARIARQLAAVGAAAEAAAETVLEIGLNLPRALKNAEPAVH